MTAYSRDEIENMTSEAYEDCFCDDDLYVSIKTCRQVSSDIFANSATGDWFRFTGAKRPRDIYAFCKKVQTWGEICRDYWQPDSGEAVYEAMENDHAAAS